jgi:hypothetical protein
MKKSAQGVVFVRDIVLMEQLSLLKKKKLHKNKAQTSALFQTVDKLFMICWHFA